VMRRAFCRIRIVLPVAGSCAHQKSRQGRPPRASIPALDSASTASISGHAARSKSKPALAPGSAVSERNAFDADTAHARMPSPTCCGDTPLRSSHRSASTRFFAGIDNSQKVARKHNLLDGLGGIIEINMRVGLWIFVAAESTRK
jgi:hypothetical protein